jgi:replicative DNA helicase
MTANDVARWMGAKIFGKDSGKLTRDEWLTTLKLIASSPVTICDAGAVTADQIDKIVRSRPETKLVIVDHIQRVTGRSGGGNDNRNHEVGYTAKTLKSLAKDVGCTVIALSQMNRASDQLGKPRLSSLRDSGEIEQEADAVIFLWTSEDNLAVNPLPVEFYLAKNRHGQMEEVKCLFHKHEKRFQALGLDHEIERVRVNQMNQERVTAMMQGAV